MSALQIYELIQSGVNGTMLIVIVILSLIQFSSVKFNPLSSLARAIGRACNKELHDKVDKIEHKLELLEQQREQDKAISARIRILQFNDELLSDTIRHSKESFDQVSDDITLYENYCKTHKNFKNNRAVRAIKNINRCYDKCCEDKDFL